MSTLWTCIPHTLYSLLTLKKLPSEPKQGSIVLWPLPKGALVHRVQITCTQNEGPQMEVNCGLNIILEWFCASFNFWNDVWTMLEQCWNDAGHFVIHYMYAVNDILPSIIRASFQHYSGVIQKTAFYYLWGFLGVLNCIQIVQSRSHYNGILEVMYY